MTINTSIHKILMIDDDLDDCELLTQVLKEIAPHLQLICLNDSKEVVPHILNHHPDLILLDINLPVTTGIQLLPLLAELKEIQPPPVVIYSCSSNPRDIEAAFQNGASLYVIKPSSLQQIKNTLMAMLEMNWQERQLITARYTTNNQFLPYTLV